MTKREFLDKLKKALVNDLSGSVIQENVNYYNDYITEEVRKGRRESDVIEELGDPWAIAKNIITSEEMKGNTQESYDSYEPGRRRENSYEQDYGSESGYRGTHVFGLDTWWKKLVLILGIIGIVVLVAANAQCRLDLHSRDFLFLSNGDMMSPARLRNIITTQIVRLLLSPVLILRSKRPSAESL